LSTRPISLKQLRLDRQVQETDVRLLPSKNPADPQLAKRLIL